MQLDVGPAIEKPLWRLLVVGGHTRSIGKTQLVCDVIQAFPETQWIAGKITQHGHGLCAADEESCDCVAAEHGCALDWETRTGTGTDSSRFLVAGAKRSFWLRTTRGDLAEGVLLLRKALEEVASGEWRATSQRQSTGTDSVDLGLCGRNTALILESNSLLQFVKPSLYFAVIDPWKDDFKESAQMALDRAQALVLRGRAAGDAPPSPLWMKLSAQLMKEKPSVMQREGEPLPQPLWVLVQRMLEAAPGVEV